MNRFPPGLDGYMAVRQQQGQEHARQIQGLTGLAALQEHMEKRSQAQALREQTAQLGPNASLADLAQAAFKAGDIKTGAALMEKATAQQLHTAQLGKLNREGAQAEQQQGATGALARLMAGGGYSETTGAPPPDQVFMNDQLARTAATQAMTTGQPFRYDVPNPGTMRALTLMSNPKGATSELLKEMSPRAAAGATSGIAKLIADRDALPEGDPRRAIYDKAIEKQSTHQAPVNVYSGSMTSGVDAQGRPVFAQSSGRPDTPPRIVEGVYPPERAATTKVENEARESEVTAGSVRQRIAKMGLLIQSRGTAGSVVGPLGMAGRVAETGIGMVSPNAATPSIDFQNEQRLLLSDVRKLVEKDPNLSKDEREALYETLGGGIWQTPGSALRTLNNVLEHVERKKVTGRSRRSTDTDKVSNDDDFQKLRSGAIFTAPDGTIRRKP